MAVTFVDVKDTKIDAAYIQIRAYQGLSTDTKPTANVGSGSSFYELDTGTCWTYDADNTNPVTSSGWWEVQ